MLKGSTSPEERAASASKGTTLSKQRSSVGAQPAAGERLSFKLTPQAQMRRASAVTSASAFSAAAAAPDSGAGSPAGATGSVLAKIGKSSSPGAGRSALTSSPEAGKSALTSSPDAGKSAPTSSPQAANLNAAAKPDSAKQGTNASHKRTQSDPISQAGATEPVAARGSDKAKVTTAVAAQPAVVSGLSTSPLVPSLTAAAELVAPSASHPSKLPAKFRISLTDTTAASESDLPDSGSVTATVYSPQAEAATQLPQAVLGSIKGKTVAQAEGSAKGSVEVEGEILADAPPLPQDERQEVPLPPLPTASAAAEQAAASAVSQAAAAAPAVAAAAAQAPPLPSAAAEGAASAAPTAAEQAAPADFPSVSHPAAAHARLSDPPSSHLPPTLGMAAKRDTGPTAKHRAPAPVHVSAAGQPGPSDPRLARKRQREESRDDMLQQTSMPRKTSLSLLPGSWPSPSLPQLPGQLLGVTKPGQPAARSSSSSQQSQRGPDRDERTPVESDSPAATHSASPAAAKLSQGRCVVGAALPGSDGTHASGSPQGSSGPVLPIGVAGPGGAGPSNPAGPAPTQSHPWGMAEPPPPPPLHWRNARLGPRPPPSWGSAGPAPLPPRPRGHPWGNTPTSGPVGNAGLLHNSCKTNSHARPGSASKSSRWDVSTPKQGSPAPTPSRPLSAPTGLPLPPPQPDPPTPAAAAAAIPTNGRDRIGAVAYLGQQQQSSAATSGALSSQVGSGNSQQAASEQDATEWHVPNPEVSNECQAKVVQLRYRWGKSNGEDSRVKGVLNVKARTWSAKRMGRLASESGIPSCLVLHPGRTTVPALASLHFSLACLILIFHQAFHQASACAL